MALRRHVRATAAPQAARNRNVAIRVPNLGIPKRDVLRQMASMPRQRRRNPIVRKSQPARRSETIILEGLATAGLGTQAHMITTMISAVRTSGRPAATIALRLAGPTICETR